VINVGLIGYGYWGPNLARNFAETEGVRLAAVADGRADRRSAAERRHPGIATAEDALAMIDRADVDAVVIATPLDTHFPLAKAAIERGKHVLVEKPFAASKADAETLASLADRRGVRLMVDHTFVYNGAVRRIRQLIDRGELGELLYLDSVRVNLGLLQHDSNVIWDLAVHDLSIMDYLIDARPVAVSADGTTGGGLGHENVAYVTVHFDSGFLAHFPRQLAGACENSSNAARWQPADAGLRRHRPERKSARLRQGRGRRRQGRRNATADSDFLSHRRYARANLRSARRRWPWSHANSPIRSLNGAHR
jgi:predicted dehydrogenase